MLYSREATANRVPGQPMIFTAPGRFESAPVVENVEVAAAAGGAGGGIVTMIGAVAQTANKNRRVGASFWCLDLNAEAITGGWGA